MKNNGIHRFLLISAILLLLSFSGFGQILTFEFAGLTGSEASANSNGNDANISSSTITRGSGLSVGANADRFNATSYTTSASIDANDYFEFTITPNLGCNFSISSVVMNFQRSGTGPRNFAIRSSIDSYAADLATGTMADVATTVVITFSFTQSNISSSTTYRIYGYASEATAGTGGIGDGAGNDLIVNGSTSCAPTCTPPTTQATSFTSTVGANNITVGWTSGNGNRVLVVARESAAVNADPTNGSTYTANANFTSGSQIGTSNYVVYNGTATSVNVTGLLPGRTYHFAIYEYNTADNCYVLTELTGNATTLAPDINILGNGVSIVDGDTSPSSTDLTSFTSVCETSGTVVNTYTIENLGVASLNVSTITITGANASDFTLSGITFGATIPNPGSTTFSVTFDPSATGTRIATLTIISDDPDEGTYNFNIQGTGNAAPTLTTQPNSTIATPSTNANFVVVATGSLLSYSWEENTGSGWTTLSETGVYSGTETATLTIASPPLTMSGYTYRAVVTNPCGSVTTNGLATLTVNEGACLDETFTTAGIPTGWTQSSVTFVSSRAEFQSANGNLNTIALSNPMTLTFDLERTASTVAKEFIISVSTTSQAAGFVSIATYTHANTTASGVTACTVDLSAYSSQPLVYIRFEKVSASSTARWGLDNILVYCATSSNTITTGAVSAPPFVLADCSSTSTGTVEFTSVGTYTSGNIYTAQLSNSSGLFTSPTNIGTLSSTANSGTINITIPAGTTTSSSYRIRVISSLPNVFGSNSTSFTVTLNCVNPCPTILGALVDACSASGEGQDEMFTFNTGTSSVNVDDMVVTFPNAIVPDYCNSGCGTNTLLDNPTYITSMSTAAGCPGLLVYSATIPANAAVIVFSGNPPTYNFDFSTLCGTGPYYVVFANNTSDTQGRFANFDGSNSLRTLSVTFSGSCSQSVSYNRNGFSSGGNGQSVAWDASGTPSYIADGCTPNIIILPLEVSVFEVQKDGNHVDLLWKVKDSHKANYFEVLHSVDGFKFEVIEKVTAFNKIVGKEKYSFAHINPEIGINYYKLKIVDANGAITFSDIRSVNFNLTNTIYIFPNPVEVGKDVFVNLQLIDENEIVEVSIIDQIGKAVLNQTYTGQKSIYINTLQLAKGVYFVKVKSKNELVSQRIIVI